MKRLAVFGALVVAAQIAGGAWSADLPEGWRQPTTKELSDPVRAENAEFLTRATADFNADGVPDDAYLLKSSTQFSGEALWIRLSGPNGTFTVSVI